MCLSNSYDVCNVMYGDALMTAIANVFTRSSGTRKNAFRNVSIAQYSTLAFRSRDREKKKMRE